MKYSLSLSLSLSLCIKLNILKISLKNLNNEGVEQVQGDVQERR